MADAPSTRPLWTCPKCGHQFVTANIWHSCTNIELDESFAGRPQALREAFERYVELIGECGPVTVIAQKTRIVIMGRVRFAGAVVRRDRLLLNFALTRALDDRRFGLTRYNDRWIAHRFEVRAPPDLAMPGLRELLCESYRDLGMQGAPMKGSSRTQPAVRTPSG